MTKKEYAVQNIGLTFDFIKQIVEHPEILETVPDGAEIDFIDKDMPLKIREDRKKKFAHYKVGHVFERIKGAI